MRKKTRLTIIWLTLEFFVFTISCFAKDKVETFQWTKFGKHKLPVNEKLTYSIKWNTMDIGMAALETKSLKEMYGRKAYSASLHITTNPLLSSLIDFNATFESLFDEESKASFEFKSKISQIKQTMEEVIIFNPVEQTYELRSGGKVKKGVIANHTQDILTAIYSIRTLALKNGNIYHLKVHFGDISYPLTIKVLRKEQVKIKSGDFVCFVVEPLLEGGSERFGLKGKLLIWITSDKRRAPCYFKLESQIGLIVAELESIASYSKSKNRTLQKL
jgi:hypothetical protein